MQSRIYICCNCSSELFTLAASKASIAGMSAFCILITDHITVPDWPEQSLICVMKGWFPAQQSRNVEVIILILCILAGVFLDSSRVKQRWHHTFADHPNTCRGPVLNTYATATFYISFPPFYWYKNTDNLRFFPCALYQIFTVLISGQISANTVSIYTTPLRTYPCIAFRRHRVSHPGAEPGSRCLDGYGVADASQFAACWKERSETGISRTMSVWVFHWLQVQFHKSEGREHWCPARC